ncbi:MAG: Fic family protein [Candidatus Woesearchaeota archaeon]|nr:Fic family protein [Candidatus Woesearchaeota archaeon]
MVVVRERKRGKQTYFYLEHSFRENGKVKKKTLYLGTKLPANIEERKKHFLRDLYKREYEQLDRIKTNFAKEQKSIPKSLREKETATFAIKFTYDTQRIEGSTLTLRDTANLLEKGITPAEKPLRDVKEAEAHEKVFYKMLKSKALSLSTVLGWHRTLLKQTKPDIAGKIRKHQVAIAGSKFLPPSPVEVDPMLHEFFAWYKENKGKIHPVELAALVHLKFVTIHPFGDGNGRMSRLMMNFALDVSKFPMMNIPYTNRNSYYNALERAQVNKDDEIFVRWFIKRYLQEHNRYL